jgi:hypothetical protein
MSNQLSIEEKDKLVAAIHGYLLGKKEVGGDSTVKKVDFLSDPKALGKMDLTASGSQGNQGKKINVWDKVNKVRLSTVKQCST